MKELERFAILFHDTYEKLAPDFGYHTRPEYRKWDINSNNAQLMLAVCEVVLADILKRFGEKDKKIAELEAHLDLLHGHPFSERDFTAMLSKIEHLEAQVEKMKKYKFFFESCSCLFAEGVEFMTKTEIYDQIKKETKQLERG